MPCDPVHAPSLSVAAIHSLASPSKRTVVGASVPPGARASATSAPSCSVSACVQGYSYCRVDPFTPLPAQCSLRFPLPTNLLSTSHSAPPCALPFLPAGPSSALPCYAVLSLQTQGCRSQGLYVVRWALTALRATRDSTAPTARVWPARTFCGLEGQASCPWGRSHRWVREEAGLGQGPEVLGAACCHPMAPD